MTYLHTPDHCSNLSKLESDIRNVLAKNQNNPKASVVAYYNSVSGEGYAVQNTSGQSVCDALHNMKVNMGLDYYSFCISDAPKISITHNEFNGNKPLFIEIKDFKGPPSDFSFSC